MHRLRVWAALSEIPEAHNEQSETQHSDRACAHDNKQRRLPPSKAALLLPKSEQDEEYRSEQNNLSSIPNHQGRRVPHPERALREIDKHPSSACYEGSPC